MTNLKLFPTWRPMEMFKELSPEEKKLINQLTIKIINDVPTQEISAWIQSFSDDIQVLMVEAVDVMNKNLDMVLKSPNQKELIAKLLKGELDETSS